MQYGEFANCTKAARTLIKINKTDECLAGLSCRITKFDRLVFRDSELREGLAVPEQLAKFFIDALNNPFIKKGVARSKPDNPIGGLVIGKRKGLMDSHIISRPRK